jgi:hypothetical protein
MTGLRLGCTGQGTVTPPAEVSPESAPGAAPASDHHETPPPADTERA